MCYLFVKLRITLSISMCTKGTSTADMAKKKKKKKKKKKNCLHEFYCLKNAFSVAIISALAFLKYASLRLTVCYKNRLGIFPRVAAIVDEASCRCLIMLGDGLRCTVFW